MAKAKEKPEETPKRSPGRSRFTISRKESPQIDGSYLDNLFADFQQQQSVQAEPQHSPEVAALHIEQLSGRADIADPPPSTTGTLSQGDLSSVGAVAKVTPRPSHTKDISVAPIEIASASRSRLISSPAFADTRTEETEEKSSVVAASTVDHFARLDSHANDELLQKVARTSRLAPGEINILRVMVRLCSERGSNTCYVKIPQLMAETSLSDRQTQRVLKNLHGLDLIEKLADYSNADRLGTLFRLKLQ